MTEESNKTNPRSGSSSGGGFKKKKTANTQSIGLEELKSHTFIYGQPGQAEKYSKSEKGIADWAGTFYGKEIFNLIHNKEEATFKEPTEPTGDKVTKGQWKRFELELKMLVEREVKYKEDKGKVFRLLMLQCQTAMRNKLEGLADYKKWEASDDVVALLNKMRELVYSTEGTQYEPWTQQAVMRTLFTTQQGDKESLANFYKRWDAQLEATEAMMGELIPHKMKGKKTEDQEKAREKFLACVFLGSTHRDRYKSAIDDLNNNFLVSKKSYPEDVTSMLNFLSNRRGHSGGQSRSVDDMMDGIKAVSFSQTGTKQAPPKGVCWVCLEPGHTKKQCPVWQAKHGNNSEAQNSESSGKSGYKKGFSGMQVHRPFQADDDGSRAVSWG